MPSIERLARGLAWTLFRVQNPSHCGWLQFPQPTIGGLEVCQAGAQEDHLSCLISKRVPSVTDEFSSSQPRPTVVTNQGVFPQKHEVKMRLCTATWALEVSYT